MKRGVILVALFISGAAAFVYEIVWFRILGLVFGSNIYALSTLLVAFIGGLALGSYIISKIDRKIKDALRMYIILEFLIAIYGLLVIWIFNILPAFYLSIKGVLTSSFVSFLIIQFLISFVVFLIPTTFMGATWPLANKLYIKDKEEIGKGTGLLYAVNNSGAIVGSLLAGFILIPIFGISTSSAIAAIMNVSIALMLVYYSRRNDKQIVQIQN